LKKVSIVTLTLCTLAKPYFHETHHVLKGIRYLLFHSFLERTAALAWIARTRSSWQDNISHIYLS